MSWFDAAGFANLAKSALKEAQKTIDKALDIKDEDHANAKPPSEETSDFFASWGLKGDEDVRATDSTADEQNTRRDERKNHPKQETSNSIWGSFTGSFFETPRLGEGNSFKRSAQSKSLQSTPVESARKSQLTTSLSLPEDYHDKNTEERTVGSESESRKNREKEKKVSGEELETILLVEEDSLLSRRAVEKTKEPLGQGESRAEGEALEGSAQSRKQNGDSLVEKQEDTENYLAESHAASEKGENDRTESEGETVRSSEKEVNNGSLSNRISLTSSSDNLGSDKKSLESVEILGSKSNSDCTTTPETDYSDSRSPSVSPSAMTGPKVNSESVEILPESAVTSPSSVEILGDWKSEGSPYLSPVEPRRSESGEVVEREDSVTPCWENVTDVRGIYDESQIEPSSSDISPYESPMEEAKTLSSNSAASSVDTTPSPGTYPDNHSSRGFVGGHNLKVSPESVEVIPDADEPDEASLAEDSFTSASESTVMTILESLQQYDQTKKARVEPPSASARMHESCPNGRKSCKDTQLNSSLDSLLEKHGLHLPLEAITTQPIRKPETVAFDRLITSTIEPSEPDVRSVEGDRGQKSDPADGAEQYLMLTDSSCEGTLIESSSEDVPTSTLVRKSEVKILEAPLTASSYVKTMLADAMVEKGEIVDVEITQVADVPRENSPISSESRSDLVKIGSDQTSGHTSGDELETTTSSDIEIISSPNGDSSSTQSRQSPAKLQPSKGGDLLTKTLKTRGHSRELSEISVGSDETNHEIEKLLKRIQEMTEILEARESKLIDVSRMNMELHEQNNSLKKQLDSFEKHAEQSQNLTQITDEYTQRLSALERKFQQAIRERDSLRKNLEHLKVEAATRLSSQEMSTINAEKDEIIKELREEGEKLSKQQLQHSNIIKKLRVKEKENDATMKSQKEQIDEQHSELERLKRSLHAKEEVERTQIEAVHTLTAKAKKQEKEILSLQEKLDNALHKMDAYKRSLDAAKLDLAETKKILAETESELKDAASNAGESCQLLAQVEDLKVKLRRSEETRVKKEEFLKHENTELLKRLEAAEARSEELSESVSMATKPLLRQLEQLQASLLHKSNSFMKQEKALSERNAELQTKVDNFVEMDRYLKEDNIALRSKISQLESKLAVKEAEKARVQDSYDTLRLEKEKLVEETLRYEQTIATLKESHSSDVEELKREISALENKLSIEKAAADAERRKNLAILEQQQNIDEELRFSPTTSIGRESVSSVNSVWPVLSDSTGIDGNSGRYAMIYDSVRAGSVSTSIFENLQAQLKQRDGEIQHLQWELSRRNTERDALNTELSTLTLKIEELNNKVAEAQALNENLNEIQTRYDALLQMYGEKMEENQELRLDLEDIKEMYKTQIDQLLMRDS